MIGRVIAPVLGIIVGAVGFITSTATENVSLVGAGAFTSFALAGFGLMWRAWAKENGRLNRVVASQVRRADTAEQQAEILLTALREANVRVPSEYWTIKTEARLVREGER